MGEQNILFKIVHLFASTYGWSVEYTLSLPFDVIMKLSAEIDASKIEELKIKTKLMGCAVAAAFNGKLEQLDKLLKNPEEKVEEIDPEIWKSQLRGLWFKAHRKKNTEHPDKEEFEILTKEFEEAYKKGEVNF